MLQHDLVPRLEADLLVKLGQERIHCVFDFGAHFSEEFFERIILVRLDYGHGNVEELILCDQLTALHLFAHVEFSIQVSQHAVE